MSKARKEKTEESEKQVKKQKKITEVNTFPIPFALGGNQENITINTPSKGSKQLFPFP